MTRALPATLFYLFSFFSIFLSALTATASDIESITVSATPISIHQAGSAYSVISREDIERRNAATLQHLLREIPGFAVSQQGSLGAVTQLRVRGAEANQVLVLIDGIEANDLAQGSEFDFSQVSTADIDRIEIVRGPQSALWGSDAMAGVVQIITRQAPGENRLSTSLEAGSFGTQRATLNAARQLDRGYVKLTADYLDSDGTNIARSGSEEDGLSNLTLGLSGGHALSDSLDLAFTIRHSDRTAEFDDIDFFTTGLPVDAAFETASRHLFGGVKLSHQATDYLDQSLSYARTDTENETQTFSPVDDRNRGIRDAFRYQLNLARAAHTFSVLAEYEKEEFRQRGAASFFGNPNQNRQAYTRSVAGEYRYDSRRLNLSVSARHDSNSEFDDANSWRITGGTFLGKTRLYAAVGQSIKNPTFTERFGFFTNFLGNPDLEPERSTQWEVGAQHSFLDDTLSLDLTWFHADLEDEINGFVFDAAGGGFTSANVDGSSEREGVELALNYLLSDSLQVRGTYTYLDATQEDFSGTDIEEVRRPMHSGSLALSWTGARGGVDLSASYTGEQADDYFPPFPPWQQRVELDAFTLVSLTGFYHLNEHVTLTARFENITDKSYEEVFGFASPGFGAYGGVRFRW